jgi:hypothetical protein
MKNQQIIWFSDSAIPLPSQLAELQRLFPGCRLIEVHDKFTDAKELLKQYRNLGGQEMVLILPSHKVELIAAVGYSPLVPVMRYVQPGEMAETQGPNCTRGRVFVEFKRVLACGHANVATNHFCRECGYGAPGHESCARCGITTSLLEHAGRGALELVEWRDEFGSMFTDLLCDNCR